MINQLTDRALLRLSGGDSQSFLQGQFSNNIDALEEGVMQLNAYCQHQGKIIALIWVMKKTFSFAHPKKKRPRVADSIKHEVKKYIKRERNKTLPEDVDF